MLTIGEFSKLSHLTSKTLRYYDEIDLLKPAYTDTESGYRYYHIEQLKTALLITRLKNYLFSLDEIKLVLNNQQNRLFMDSKMQEKKKEMTERLESYKLLLNRLNQDIEALEAKKSIMAHLDSIEVKLVDYQPSPILYQRKQINEKEFLNGFIELFSKIVFNKLTPAARPLAIFHSKEYSPDHFDIEFAIPIEQETSETKKFDPGLCAKAVLMGSYDELPSVHTKLHVWMSDNQYVLNGQVFEVYLTDPHHVSASNNIIEVYFPVKYIGEGDR